MSSNAVETRHGSIELDGATVAYQVDGNGPALVLVSGTGGNLNTNWDHLIPALVGSYTMIRVDYAGSSGRTRDPAAVLTVERLASQVMAGVGAAGVSDFHLLGYSLGSAVAVHIAAHYPQQVRSLVLLAGFASGRDTRFALQAALWKDLIDHDPRSFAGLIVLTGLSPEVVSSFDETTLTAWIDAIYHNNDWPGILRQIELDGQLDVTPLLPRIQAPTLSIGCTHDYVVPPLHARKLKDAIPGAQYVEVASGHLVPFEQPQTMLEFALGFINKHN